MKRKIIRLDIYDFESKLKEIKIIDINQIVSVRYDNEKNKLYLNLSNGMFPSFKAPIEQVEIFESLLRKRNQKIKNIKILEKLAFKQEV